jgi:hypothetical protein
MRKRPAGLRAELALVNGKLGRRQPSGIIPALDVLPCPENGIDVGKVPVVIALVKTRIHPFLDIPLFGLLIDGKLFDDRFPSWDILIIKPCIFAGLGEVGEKLLDDGDVNGGVDDRGAGVGTCARCPWAASGYWACFRGRTDG